MWFNNLQLYRITKPVTFTTDEVEEKLANNAFRPCGSLELSSYGWVSPIGRHGRQMTHVTNGHIMVCARKEEKVLPAAVVREIVNDKAAEIEDEQARPVRRKERESIRDEVMQDLLPKAFTRSALTINASSAKKAEELLTALRRSLGSLSVTRLSLEHPPATVMTRWLAEEDAPSDFVIEDECEMREPGDDGGIVRCKRQDLTSDEIQAHLDANKQVVKLAVSWQENLFCLISDDLSIKRLRFSDELLEKGSEVNAEDIAARFDNDFSIMTLELSRFIPSLLDAFGGEKGELIIPENQAA